jgi:hypothetical protein
VTLYHYTCRHSHGEITDSLRPFGAYVPGGLVWLTDLDVPMRDALGLTSVTLSCDRTAYRYRVTDEASCVRWVDYRSKVDRVIVRGLEEAHGAMPMHWWVSEQRVPVAFDPIGGTP